MVLGMRIIQTTIQVTVLEVEIPAGPTVAKAAGATPAPLPLIPPPRRVLETESFRALQRWLGSAA